ncbi:MAG: histidine-type phosphatase [Candidatus Limisoma sp.]
MKRIFVWALLTVVAVASALAFDYDSGRASLSPYPVRNATVQYPDSLTPVFVNHVSRHGSRYPASSHFTMLIHRALERAEREKTITPLGRQFKADVERVISATANRWGELDSIGEREHQGIAERMYANFPQLFVDSHVVAISSSSPRCVHSMYAATGALARRAKGISLTTSSGPEFSPLMRNFDLDSLYKQYRTDTAYTSTYNRFAAANITIDPLLRILGERFPLDYDKVYDLALAEYYVVAGMDCMGLKIDASKYFTVEEYRRMWSVFNFRQYLLYSASTLSQRPARLAAPLLQDIISTADDVLQGKLTASAKLRFGHAETLMPLLALMQVPGCYYLTNYYDTVADNWRDYESFPMAANLQLVYFTAPSGAVYVRAYLNEKPIKLLRGSKSDFVSWKQLRLHLYELLPLED